MPSFRLPPVKRMSRAENAYWLVTFLPLVVAPWAAYEVISGERRNAVMWVLLVVLTAVFVIGVRGLIQIKKHRS